MYKNKRWKKTPWQKIMIASKKGTSLKLSFEEVLRLSMDGAIATRAEKDDYEEEDGRFDE